jgi:hypothetical protein
MSKRAATEVAATAAAPPPLDKRTRLSSIRPFVNDGAYRAIFLSSAPWVNFNRLGECLGFNARFSALYGGRFRPPADGFFAGIPPFLKPREITNETVQLVLQGAEVQSNRVIICRLSENNLRMHVVG